MFSLLEKAITRETVDFSLSTVKEICRSFIFSIRGTKEVYEVMLPHIRRNLDSFSCNEKCYLLLSFHKRKVLTKQFAKELELAITQRLR